MREVEQAVFPTLEHLEAQKPWVLDAPKDAAPMLSLCVRPAEGERQFVERIRFDPEQGVVGDRWRRKTWMHLPDGSPDPRIQVCLLGSRVLQLVRREGTAMIHPGDTIIADMDFSEANLPAGQRLQVGTAVLEVSDVFNTGCAKWQQRYGPAALRWINRPENRALRLRGILARVVTAGEATLGDVVRKLG